MTKELNQMTDEELGQLFPIILSEPNPEWSFLKNKLLPRQ